MQIVPSDPPQSWHGRTVGAAGVAPPSGPPGSESGSADGASGQFGPVVDHDGRRPNHYTGAEHLVDEALVLRIPHRPEVVDELDRVAYTLDTTDEAGHQPATNPLGSTGCLAGVGIDQTNP